MSLKKPNLLMGKKILDRMSYIEDCSGDQKNSQWGQYLPSKCSQKIAKATEKAKAQKVTTTLKASFTETVPNTQKVTNSLKAVSFKSSSFSKS
jgi:hypothetical protein